MGFFKVLGSIGAALFGGGGGNQLANKVIDKVLPQTQNEKDANAITAEDEDIKDVSSARNYDPKDMPVIVYQPGMGIIPWILLWILDLIDHVVDSINHMIRPGILIWLIGGFMGKWPIPNPNVVDPQLWLTFKIAVSFFYGGRTIVKDVIPGIQAIVGMVKK